MPVCRYGSKSMYACVSQKACVVHAGMPVSLLCRKASFHASVEFCFHLNLFSCSLWNTCFHTYVGKPISMSVSESLFLCLRQKVCFLARVWMPVSITCVEKPVSMSMSENLFLCLGQKAYFPVCVGMPVSMSMSESLFPRLCRRACLHLSPNLHRKAW